MNFLRVISHTSSYNALICLQRVGAGDEENTHAHILLRSEEG